MKMLDWIKNSTAEMVAGLKWPFRVRMINRTLESLIDSATVAQDRIDSALVEKRKALTNAKEEKDVRGILKEILDLKAELIAAKEVSALAADEKAFLNSDAPAEK